MTREFFEVETLVREWAKERNIYDVVNGSDPHKQMVKLAEEYCELNEALLAHDLEKSIDGIGDMLVVLTNIAYFIKTDLNTCYNSAYEQIKDRKGKMVNGLFVKEV